MFKFCCNKLMKILRESVESDKFILYCEVCHTREEIVLDKFEKIPQSDQVELYASAIKYMNLVEGLTKEEFFVLISTDNPTDIKRILQKPNISDETAKSYGKLIKSFARKFEREDIPRELERQTRNLPQSDIFNEWIRKLEEVEKRVEEIEKNLKELEKRIEELEKKFKESEKKDEDDDLNLEDEESNVVPSEVSFRHSIKGEQYVKVFRNDNNVYQVIKDFKRQGTLYGNQKIGVKLFFVDENGYEFAVYENINTRGLTKKQIQDLISEKVEEIELKNEENSAYCCGISIFGFR